MKNVLRRAVVLEIIVDALLLLLPHKIEVVSMTMILVYLYIPFYFIVSSDRKAEWVVTELQPAWNNSCGNKRNTVDT